DKNGGRGVRRQQAVFGRGGERNGGFSDGTIDSLASGGCCGSPGSKSSSWKVATKLTAELTLHTPNFPTEQVASDIATALRSSDERVEEHRLAARQQLEQRRRAVTAKIDRAYEDLFSERISDEFWTRRSTEWEIEIAT